MNDVLHTISDIRYFLTDNYVLILFSLGLVAFLLLLLNKMALKIFIGIGLFLTLPFIITLILAISICPTNCGEKGIIFVLPFVAFFPAVPGAIILIPATLKLYWINRKQRNNPESDAE